MSEQTKNQKSKNKITNDLTAVLMGAAITAMSGCVAVPADRVYAPRPTPVYGPVIYYDYSPYYYGTSLYYPHHYYHSEHFNSSSHHPRFSSPSPHVSPRVSPQTRSQPNNHSPSRHR